MAFWSQTLQPSSRNSPAFFTPRRKPTISPIADLNASLRVVMAGKPFCKSKRSMAPGRLMVRMPVRLPCSVPLSMTSRTRSKYCFMAYL
ncbi:hypothetical protein D3C85_1753960 [compost metagenome]